MLMCATAAFASQSPVFKPISSLSPLPTNEIRKLHQDSEGYLWISTYGGLVRYDGYDYLIYKLDPATHEQVLNSFVNLVKEDDNHCMWIGTHDGLYVLDKLTDQLSKIDCPTLSHSRVEDIIPATDGSLWVATNKGLFVRREGKQEFEYCTGKEWDLDPTDMKALMQDKQGFLWIGTWSDGLIRYDIERRKAHKYWMIPQLKSSHVIFLDKDDNVWIGTFGSGLVRLIDPYNMQRQDYVLYQHQDNNPNSLADNIIYSIAQEPVSGEMWIGSRSGLTLFSADSANPQFRNFIPGKDANDLPYNEVNSIISTNENLMWLGFLGGGVYSVDVQEKDVKGDPMPKVYEHFGTNSVSNIFEDQADGVYWLNLAGFGLTSYSPKTGDFRNFRQITELADYDQLLYVHSITYNEKTAEFCFGTEQGLIFYNKRTRHVRLISNTAGAKMQDDYICSVFFDHNSTMWVCTRADIGCMIGDTAYLSLNKMLAPGETPMGRDMVSAVDEDKHGNLWIVTRNNGIYCASTTPEGKRLKHYSKADATMFTEGGLCLHIDSRDNIWVGTEIGLLLYDNHKEVFSLYRPKELIYYGGTYVNGVWEDWKHSLWLATNTGVLEIHIDESREPDFIRLYTSEDGLLDDSFHRNSFCATSDGNLLIGSMHGINYIPIRVPQPHTTQSNISITDFRIFNRSLREFSEEERTDISDNAIQYAQKIVLPHDMNNFSIEFSLLNFRDVSKNRYQYMLSGYDKEMVLTDAKHRFAYYNNLPAGTYHFIVEGSNAENLKNPARHMLTIRIKPAPWLSWWAYLIYLVLVAAIVYIVWRMQNNRLRLEKAVEISEMNRKTSEELNQAKLQFFTNITHELLTPLSIIIASVDELRQKNPDVQEYNLITNNALRLMRLIQQILEFRKAESGNLRLKVSEGDIVSFVENCVNTFRPLASRRNITFQFVNNISDTYVCIFDTDKLDKILYNLLSNAEKYNRDNGSVIVTLNLDEAEDNVIITIEDTGNGMSNEELSNIFKRFYDGSYRQHHTIGTGIGLSLVKNLVDIHHGRIAVSTKQGEGTKFTITIPIQEDEYLESEKENIEHAYSELPNPRVGTEPSYNYQITDDIDNSLLTKTHVMLVEDNDDMRFILQRHLSQYCEVLSVQDADTAVQLLKQENAVDIIISDIMMPGMNGYDFCAFVKNTLEFCHIPVILLTAKQTSADKITGYEVGADSYLTKPINLDELDALIKNQIKRKERLVVDYKKQLIFNVKELNYTSMDEKFMQKAVDYVNKHLTDAQFSLADFTEEMNMSRTTLSDKLKSLTGMTPSRFINDIRLRAACQLLEQKAGTIRVSELAYLVGFNDPKYFSTLFKKKYGVSPQEYKRKSNS